MGVLGIMTLPLLSPSFWASKKAFFLFLLVVGFCYLPIPNHQLSTDDYMIYHVLKGSQALSDAGFSNTDPTASLIDRLSNAFHFFSGEKGNLSDMQNYGSLPWWIDQNAQMVMFRPVAAFTHWLDFQLFDKNVILMQLHSLAWFLFLAWSIFRFYKVVLNARYGLVFFASLLYLLDYSLLYSSTWLAARNAHMVVAFACWCLYFHHKFADTEKIHYLCISLLFLTVGLLTAEAGIATSAYLFAYAVTLDKRGWFKGCLTIVPAAVIIVVWRLIYTELGYGSKWIGLYVDPLYSPIAFLESLFLNYGYYAFSQLTGLVLGVKWIFPEGRIYVQIFALLFSILCLLIIIKPLKKHAFVRFCLIGSLISLIPFCAHTSNNVRSLFFCSIGFFPIIAYLFQQLWYSTSSKFSRLFAYFIITSFLVFPVIFKAGLSSLSALDDVDSESKKITRKILNGGGDTTENGIVYLTYPNGFAIYLPYRWDWYGLTLPEHIFQLVPGLNGYSLSRVDQRQFVLTSKSQFVLSPETEITNDGGQKPFVDFLYMYQRMHGMTSRPKANFSEGQVFEFEAYKVTILEADNSGEVSQIQIDFAEKVDVESLNWRYWDWGDKRFVQVPLLPVGESLSINSKWDANKQQITYRPSNIWVSESSKPEAHDAIANN